MVDELHPDDVSGRSKPDGEEEVLDAGSRVAGRMIVKRDDRRRASDQRFSVDFPWVGYAGVERANRHEAGRDEAVTSIQKHDAKSLHRMGAKLRQQVRGDVSRSQELWTSRRRREKRAAAKLDGGLDAARLHRPDAGHLPQPVAVQPRQPVRAASQRENLVRERQCACAGCTVADEDREQLVVAQCTDAASLQLLAGPIAWRQIHHERRSAWKRPAILFMRMRRLVCAVVLAAAFVACSEPPTKEHDQAQGALAAARAAGASAYASEELRTAEKALAGYEAAVGQRDYRLALSLAIDARESAYAAARRAADEKTRARTEAEQLIAAVQKGATTIEQRLAGKTGPRPTRPIATRLDGTLKAATAALQKARARLAAEDYRGVVAVLTPVREALDGDLAVASPARGRAGG